GQFTQIGFRFRFGCGFPRHQPHTAQLRKRVDDLLSNAFAKVLLVAPGAVIGKRQNDYGVAADQRLRSRALGRRRLEGPESRRVAALWQFDDHRVLLALLAVITRQLRSQPSRLNANDRVVSGVERLRFAEHLDPHYELLQALAAAVNGLFDNEREKSFEPVGL